MQLWRDLVSTHDTLQVSPLCMSGGFGAQAAPHSADGTPKTPPEVTPDSTVSRCSGELFLDPCAFRISGQLPNRRALLSLARAASTWDDRCCVFFSPSALAPYLCLILF
ncbi:hypothetical protein GGTG_07013 [Gaeumannomyces tritici R3-111a-1]|uniref:Uncharacterized protein n=1 Tax=Gaeumannomyces tritici (strain R3-111a-1) TaxID=644352 RepID=J3P0G7_GAET3|nr:hypothetical protein GGTG_07013 [Gaeumannomyces tritici R3-111a-1]EJT77100.1 hypothetical protein GGTG_07013 [Gaeumannomyces tritici R3-111a-1]